MIDIDIEIKKYFQSIGKTIVIRENIFNKAILYFEVDDKEIAVYLPFKKSIEYYPRNKGETTAKQALSFLKLKAFA